MALQGRRREEEREKESETESQRKSVNEWESGRVVESVRE